MDITGENIDLMFKGFNTKFNDFHAQTTPMWEQVAMMHRSTGSEEVYGWLAELPKIREWLGDRVVSQIETTDYVIKNRKFEQTIRVRREDIEDDKLGLYDARIRMMSYHAATHPDELVFGLLANGFDTMTYDGQNFFDTDHPYVDADGVQQSASNLIDGAGPGWYLLDTSRPIKPMVFQERIPYTPQQLSDDSDTHVFLKDEYLYGMRARVNAGFGLWQLAVGSRAVLDAQNYAAARVLMQSRRYNGGRVMGLSPTLLVVSPENEGPAREVLKANRIGGGDDNIWRDSAELLVTPYLNS